MRLWMRVARSAVFISVMAGGGLCGLLVFPLACGAPATSPAAAIAPAAAGDAPRTLEPMHLSPLKEGVWTYQVIEGDGKGALVTQTVKPDATDAIAPWRRIFSANHVIAHLRQEPDGSIVMPANEILDHDVINTFDPPQIVLPAPSALGSPVHVISKVATSLRSGLKMQIDHGTADLTLTPAGIVNITTPAGSFVCHRIELALDLKFGLGHVESSATLDYADGVGLVAEDYHEKATAFLMTSTTTRKTVLMKFP